MLILGLLLLATPAAGQEWLVNREEFRYIGTRLTIEVATEAPGTIQVTRGRPGIVRVAGRTSTGFAASGLSRDNVLTLSAMADAGSVNYLVSVPEGVWIDLRLPDRHNSESIGGQARGRTFDWASTGAATAAYQDPAYPEQAPRIAPGLAVSGNTMEPRRGLFTLLADDLAPETIALPRTDVLTTLTVRLGEDRFRVAASRPMNVNAGDGRTLEIRPSWATEIALDVPAGTRHLTVLLGDVPALVIRDGEPASTCTPVTRQWLSEGRQWFTFSPMSESLTCRP
ncbi:MAG TPA: hypothetical protein VK966_08915 [Longimicrobiales bacterium]|nr:hypothetical protein [Longimicrobiales bacterium]